MKHLKSFIAGFLSTFVFHQGSLAVLFFSGLLPRAPFDFSPTAPLGVPAVVSLAFFGGLWGVLIWQVLETVLKNKSKLWFSIILGAIGPTAVAVTVVFPAKGIPFNPQVIPVGLFLNAMWGLGLWIFMRLFNKVKST